MRKDQFFEKHRHLNIQRQELERKWRVLEAQREMEEIDQQWKQLTANSLTHTTPGSVSSSHSGGAGKTHS